MTLTDRLYRAITAASWQAVGAATGGLDDRDETGDGSVRVAGDGVPAWTVRTVAGRHDDRSIYLPNLMVETGQRRYCGGDGAWPRFSRIHFVLGGVHVERFEPTPELEAELNAPLRHLWLEWLRRERPTCSLAGRNLGVMAGRCAHLMSRRMLLDLDPALDLFLPTESP